MTIIARPDNVRFIAEGLDHPECVSFGPDGKLYAGGEAGQIYRIDPATGEVRELARTGGFNLGIAVDANLNVYACDIQGKALHRLSPDGKVTTLFRGTPDRPLEVPNYAVFDADGRLYLSDSGDYWNPEGTGCIYRLAPDGKAELFHPGPLQFPNGLAIDPAGEYLYIAESTAPRISRIPLNGSGRAHRPEEVARLQDCVPDGLAFCRSGRLFVGCYKPDSIFCLEPDGRLNTVITDPTGELLSRPTNVAIGHGTLLFANLGGWHIGAISFEVEPVIHHFKLARPA